MDFEQALGNARISGQIEDLIRRAIGGGSPRSPSPSPPAPPTSSGRPSRTGTSPKDIISDHRDVPKSVLKSLMDSANAQRDYANRIHDLEKGTETVGNKYLDGIVKNVLGFSASMGGAYSGLDAQMQEFKNLDARGFMKQINELGASVDKAASDLANAGKNSFTDFTDAMNDFTYSFRDDETYQILRDNANNFGANLSDAGKDIAKRLNDGFPVTGDKLKILSAELENARKVTKDYTDEQLKNIRKEMTLATLRKSRDDKLSQVLGVRTLEFTGFLSLLGIGLKGAYNDFRKVASAGLAGHFLDISVSSARLGISVEKMTEIYRSNARGLAMGMGPAFVDSISTGQNGLFALGLGLEEAAVGANSFYKNAISSGLNPRQTDKLNDSIKFQTDAFKDLRSVTGATIEEFNSMNESMAQNIDNMTLALRFAPQERNARFQELISLRNEFAMRGLSAKAADSMVTAMQGFTKSTLKDRYEAAAKLQQAAGLMGMGVQGQRIAELARKRNRSGSEAAELASMTGELKGRMAQFGNAGPLAENLTDVLDEGLGGAAKGLMEAGVQLKLAADAQMGITKGELIAEGKKNELSGGIAKSLMTIDQAANLLNSSLGKILIAIVGLGVSSAMGGAKGFLSMIGNVFPALGRVLPTVLNFGKIFTVVGGIVMAVGAAFDSITGLFGIGAAKIDKALDEENWSRMNAMEKFESGIYRFIEGLLRFFFMDNIANEAAASRIKNETEYLDKEKRTHAKKQELQQAEIKSAEAYLGAVHGSISARDLTSGNTSIRTDAVDNSQSKDKNGTPPPINKETSGVNGNTLPLGTVTSSTASSSKPATLDDILKKLEELCAATIEDTDKVTTVLARLQPSKFGSGPGLRLS